MLYLDQMINSVEEIERSNYDYKVIDKNIDIFVNYLNVILAKPRNEESSDILKEGNLKYYIDYYGWSDNYAVLTKTHLNFYEDK